ncbi:MAG: uroporphyrinogen-III C-methyltransferase [Dehalococcoidales bacterium]
MKPGKVYLVGAGPGDAGLITVKGLDCLKKAEVVIYDRLLDERLLDAAPQGAERIYAGKTAGHHVKKQSEINQLLVEKAKEGKIVVRLKGGDPFVLGRGGEEAEALKQNGLPFEVVPGITSAVAVPAYAGIPVTQRRLASSFAVITGHEDPAKGQTSIAWDRLATGVDTLVFLMGTGNLSQIVQKLIDNGRDPATPVAMIKEGTSPSQKTITSTLAGIVAEARSSNFSPPAVIVVGEVVNLRPKLRWFDNQPLFGKKVLVTRARRQASALSQLLLKCGARPVEMPAIEIKDIADTGQLDRAILSLEDYQWLVFTSSNGVAAFFERLYALNRDARWLRGIKLGVIGPATAAAVVEKGLRPDYIPKDFTTDGFLAGLQDRDIKGCRFLLPRADIAPRGLIDGINQLGAEADEVTAYRTVAAAEAIARGKQLLKKGEIDVITFTSSSTVSNLLKALDGKLALIQGAAVACIGPVTAATAEKAGLKVAIAASEHTIPGLVAAMEEYYKEKEGD